MFFTSHIGNFRQEERLSRYNPSGLGEGSVGWSRTRVILLSVTGNCRRISSPPNEAEITFLYLCYATEVHSFNILVTVPPRIDSGSCIE